MATLWKTLMMVRRCNRRGFWVRVVCVVLQNVLPLLNLVVLKYLIDALQTFVRIAPTGFDVGDLLFTDIGKYVAVFCGVFLLGRVVASVSSVNSDILTQKLTDYVSDKIQTQSSLLDMSYYDNPDFHDTFHRAQQEAVFRPLQVLDAYMSLCGSLISVAGVGTMMLTGSWMVVVVMLVAVVPAFMVKLVKSRRIYHFRRSHTQHYRRTNYYAALLTHRDYAKEVRVFGLAPYFRGRYVEMRRRLVSRLLRISYGIAVRDTLCSIVEVAALLVVLLLLVGDAVGGAITIGGFVMLFEAFRKGQGSLQSLASSVAALYDCRLFANNLYEFLRLRPSVVSPRQPLPFPTQIDEVRFDDVCFRYPNMQHDVLSHLSLVARRGEVCHIEGENGYGKTTMLKLLLRLYDVNAGSVSINGIDIRRFDINELRRNVGAVFQDYVRFNCTVRENITFGAVDKPVDEARMKWAAAMSGADTIVERLPYRYDTLLGRMFDGGEELSMGQWQRIALARQLYGDAPVLFFDEPMAWMDHATRRRFLAALEELSPRKIVFLVQHK